MIHVILSLPRTILSAASLFPSLQVCNAPQFIPARRYNHTGTLIKGKAPALKTETVNQTAPNKIPHYGGRQQHVSVSRHHSTVARNNYNLSLGVVLTVCCIYSGGLPAIPLTSIAIYLSHSVSSEPK